MAGKRAEVVRRWCLMLLKERFVKDRQEGKLGRSGLGGGCDG